MTTIVSSYRRNECLTIQQGTFVCSGDIRLSLAENLAALINTQDNQAYQQLTIRVTQSKRANILAKLNNMNMNQAQGRPSANGSRRTRR